MNRTARRPGAQQVDFWTRVGRFRPFGRAVRCDRGPVAVRLPGELLLIRICELQPEERESQRGLKLPIKSRPMSAFRRAEIQPGMSVNGKRSSTAAARIRLSIVQSGQSCN